MRALRRLFARELATGSAGSHREMRAWRSLFQLVLHRITTERRSTPDIGRLLPPWMSPILAMGIIARLTPAMPGPEVNLVSFPVLSQIKPQAPIIYSSLTTAVRTIS